MGGKRWHLICLCKPSKSSVTQMPRLERHHVWFLTFTWVHFVPVWRSRWKKKRAPFLSFYPCFQSIPNSIALPPLCLCSIKMYQAGWRITGRGGLFIPSPPAHINDLAPVVPRRGDVHINSSHTRKRRGTRVEHRWVAGKRGETEGMGRGSATAFHPHCVIYNITDTTTHKFAQGVHWEREKKKKLYDFVGVKKMNELTTVNMSPCRCDTFPVSANQEHIHHL